MSYIEELKNKILGGYEINKAEAVKLSDESLEDLAKAANEIRQYFCGDKFDICTIINGKSGRCSEDCKYCAQSAHYKTNVETYPLLDTEPILREAQYNYNKGVMRYSVVTSGRALSDAEVDKLAESLSKVHEQCPVKLCVSGGLLNEAQFKKLHDAGVERVHNNLESSRHHFSQVCTTHAFADKVNAIKAAQKAGMDVCSGGIMGIGETMEDRVDMALELRSLGINSVPVNILNPIAGTPYEYNKRLSDEEILRIIAVYRFILPKAFIRLAGGRGLLADKGRACFKAGANAAISGDMLTTSGISIDTDMQMIAELGFKCEI